MQFFHLASLICLCNLFVVQTNYELPPFIPNDYLFETHKDKGTEKWEIYAWAVRDAMSKASGIPKCDTASFAHKEEYMIKVGTTKPRKSKKKTTGTPEKNKTD